MLYAFLIFLLVLDYVVHSIVFYIFLLRRHGCYSFVSLIKAGLRRLHSVHEQFKQFYHAGARSKKKFRSCMVERNVVPIESFSRMICVSSPILRYPIALNIKKKIVSIIRKTFTCTENDPGFQNSRIASPNDAH